MNELHLIGMIVILLFPIPRCYQLCFRLSKAKDCRGVILNNKAIASLINAEGGHIGFSS